MHLFHYLILFPGVSNEKPITIVENGASGVSAPHILGFQCVLYLLSYFCCLCCFDSVPLLSILILLSILTDSTTLLPPHVRVQQEENGSNSLAQQLQVIIKGISGATSTSSGTGHGCSTRSSQFSPTRVLSSLYSGFYG